MRYYDHSRVKVNLILKPNKLNKAYYGVNFWNNYIEINYFPLKRDVRHLLSLSGPATELKLLTNAEYSIYFDLVQLILDTIDFSHIVISMRLTRLVVLVESTKLSF